MERSLLEALVGGHGEAPKPFGVGQVTPNLPTKVIPTNIA